MFSEDREKKCYAIKLTKIITQCSLRLFIVYTQLSFLANKNIFLEGNMIRWCLNLMSTEVKIRWQVRSEMILGTVESLNYNVGSCLYTLKYFPFIQFFSLFFLKQGCTQLCNSLSFPFILWKHTSTSLHKSEQDTDTVFNIWLKASFEFLIWISKRL